MSLLEIVLWVVGVAVILPLGASLLLNTLLKNIDSEGIYDEEDA